MLDTIASHHIIADLQNLPLHSQYEGPDDVVLDNGFGLPITHVGATQLSSPLHLHPTLFTLTLTLTLFK